MTLAAFFDPVGDDEEPSLRPVALAGLLTIVLSFGGFLAWSLLASLDAAAIAPGVVMVDSHRKTIQHLEGGILAELLVGEGDEVAAGEVLLRLDDTLARATLGQLQTQYFSALARATRLKAEQDDSREIVFPPELTARAADAAVADIVATEERLFRARWASYDDGVAVQRQRIAQFTEEIAAIDAQVAATVDQLSFTQDELASVQQLYNAGYERRPRLLELQRRASELDGRRGELQARRAQTREAINGAELEIIELQSARRTEAVDQLRDTQAMLADLTDRIGAARDVMERTVIRSPQAGVVTDLRIFTTGGVVTPGMAILDVVPGGDDLVVEAMVDPRDIDSVAPGLPAQVRLTAYKQRLVPTFDGEVVTVSADARVDERTGTAYFVARVRLDPEAVDAASRVALYPGMPAEVIITTGERRAIDYFISPIADVMRRSFREE